MGGREKDEIQDEDMLWFVSLVWMEGWESSAEQMETMREEGD